MDTLCRAAQVNLTMGAGGLVGISPDAELCADWRSFYRIAHIRMLVRSRTLCLYGRANTRFGNIVAWLCQTAPLWVLVRVCTLLQEQ